MTRNPEFGKALIFAGPHGAGKDTLEARFTDNQPNAARVIRHITRPKGEGEIDGKDYYFTDDDTFDAMAQRQDFIEHAEYVGSKSGTTSAELLGKLKTMEFASLSANFEDGLSLHRKIGARGIQSTCFFIAPCSEEIMENDEDQYLHLLRERMLKRKRNTDIIDGRLRKASHYRELYLENADEVPYVDNSDGYLERASRAIAYIALNS